MFARTLHWPTLMAIVLLATPRAWAAELMVTEVTGLSFDLLPSQDLLVFSALGQVWRAPATGGLAAPLTPPELVLDRPRISPDGRFVVAEGGDRQDRRTLWLIELATGQANELVTRPGDHGDAAWRPDGQVIAYSSSAGGARDLWQIRLVDGVESRLTQAPGDEFDPAWDGDGRSLLYASRGATGHAIHRLSAGGRTETLVTGERPLAAPVRRPGGPTLLYVETLPDGRRALQMLLTASELTIKTLQSGGDLEAEPIVWLDRDRYVVAYGGQLHVHELAGAGKERLPVTAFVSVRPPTATRGTRTAPGASDIAVASPPVVLRVARAFDPVRGEYLVDRDIRLENGRIAEIAPRRDWPGLQVIAFDGSTLLPGIIDTALRPQAPRGTARLVAGVTAIAVEPGPAQAGGQPSPAPRQLSLSFVDVSGIEHHAERIRAILDARANGLAVTTRHLLPDLRFGVTQLRGGPAARGRPVYSDLLGLIASAGVDVVGPTAGVTTAGVAWRQSRIAAALGAVGEPPAALAPAIELLREVAGGVPVAEALRARTLQAADAAGRDDLGRLRAGALADFVIVAGDPLEQPETLLDPIAVMLGGRLMAVGGLLERLPARRDSLQIDDSADIR